MMYRYRYQSYTEIIFRKEILWETRQMVRVEGGEDGEGAKGTVLPDLNTNKIIKFGL
jgi:hypothetical protein